ncbi:hypothetical protein J0904_04700 [Acinetobacter bereziniae]|uniref:hypothetical protein n=1 Tax=Acinetobacter bereziniae TaxID=106648 RepID=UPI00207618EC|nr:hypothetical protein [Acinetobacter bereziniae]MCM8511386.1 hypothetical protein [Acinetobacter bereziniae]
MTKNFIIFSFSFIMTACNSIQSSHQNTETADLSKMANCDQVKDTLKSTLVNLDDLKKQKKIASTGNAMNAAAALLSLNPLALFDHSLTGNLDDLIESYSNQIVLLNKLQQEKCSQ